MEIESLGLADQLEDAELLDSIEEYLVRVTTGLQKYLNSTNNNLPLPQKHICLEETPERIYWHYGQLVGLKDLLNLIVRQRLRAK